MLHAADLEPAVASVQVQRPQRATLGLGGWYYVPAEAAVVWGRRIVASNESGTLPMGDATSMQLHT